MLSIKKSTLNIKTQIGYKGKKWKKPYHANTNLKKGGVQYKSDFRTTILPRIKIVIS